ncbi:fungal-specific transcription factor domain-containing protein [Aspergillus unguis]
MPAPKIAIPRATAVKAAAQRRRSARACEPCRSRKVKCDAERPVCRKCREHGLACGYIDIKRIRDQKQLEVLNEKVEKYEKLLRELEGEVEGATGRRIRRALAAQADDGDEADDSDMDSNTSHGSLEEIDLVKEDLNRSDKTVATGFFGKNSEVAWMHKLEDVSDQRAQSNTGMESEHKPSTWNKDISITSMNYHLDDLSIPFPDSVDPFAVPEKELADQYFDAYMESVHPSFTVIRKNTFMAQYEQFFKKTQFSPPRKWLAVLNMIMALGCRYCKLTGRVDERERDTDDTEFLNRARKLCLSGNVLFEHDDLQQIQVVLLTAVYLIALGQVNGASKFSSMALRSAISLGINLRFKDDKTPYASKEARTRLWWSIFLLEHLITSITGRISGCSEELSAALLPVPFEEEGTHGNPNLCEIFRDPELQSSRLQLTIFQSSEEAQDSAAWVSKCEPSPTLLFHCIVDLNVISQTVINSVYSIQGLRETPDRVEQRLQKHSRSMDIWLKKVPPHYRFTVSETDDTYCAPCDSDADPEYARERMTLAVYYYSARITLCRPCLSHTPTSLQAVSTKDISKSRAAFRALMTLTCLRASTSLLSILPPVPDTAWLTSVTPWWTILHYMMQATTALLIGLSTRSAEDAEVPATKTTSNERQPVPPLKRSEMVNQTKKALRWLHHLGFSSMAARRAFLLCESFMIRIGPSLGLDSSDLPSGKDFPPDVDVDLFGPGKSSGSAGLSNPGSHDEYFGYRDASISALDGLAMADD